MDTIDHFSVLLLILDLNYRRNNGLRKSLLFNRNYLFTVGNQLYQMFSPCLFIRHPKIKVITTFS